MKVITANLNGIRSAARKGFFDWLIAQDADYICLQETKAQMHVLTDPLFRPQGYHCFFHDAEKKGYSGVGLYTRHQPNDVSYGLGWHTADTEGRYVQADFADVSIASIYLPSGTSGDERQALKYEFMEKYTPILQRIASAGKPFIIAGDWNIAHKNIDLKNWKSNQKNSGFLPEERAWLDHLFNEMGLVDAFRQVNTHPEEYTWWSFRGRARENNTGWRIDYQIVTPELKNKITAVGVYRDTLFSDHAPLIVEYDV